MRSGTIPTRSGISCPDSTLDAAQQQNLMASALRQRWRAQTGLLSALPARYTQVMDDLLARMEAGSLFTEESCSFSQQDLLANLSTWLDKAAQTLAV